jgi:hypothetical protein
MMAHKPARGRWSDHHHTFRCRRPTAYLLGWRDSAVEIRRPSCYSAESCTDVASGSASITPCPACPAVERTSCSPGLGSQSSSTVVSGTAALTTPPHLPATPHGGGPSSRATSVETARPTSICSLTAGRSCASGNTPTCWRRRLSSSGNGRPPPVARIPSPPSAHHLRRELSSMALTVIPMCSARRLGTALPTCKAPFSTPPTTWAVGENVCRSMASRRVIARSCSGCAKRPRVMFVQPDVNVGATRSHHILP